MKVENRRGIIYPYSSQCLFIKHYKTRLFKYIEMFTTKKKKGKFIIKQSDIFHISA